MTVATLPDYFGRAIFSEDVRLETAGTLSIVGFLPGGVDVAEFPGALPKLAVTIEWQQKVLVPLLPVALKIFAPGGSEEPVWEHTHSEEALRGAIPLAGGEHLGPHPGPEVIRIYQIAIFSMFAMKEPGWVQVRAFRGDEVLAIGGLRIIQTHA